MSDSFEDLFDNLDAVSHILPTSIAGKPTTRAKQLAGSHFSQTKKIKEALSTLAFKSNHTLLRTSGISIESLYTAVANFNKHILETSKTFTVCSTCYTAFKKGKPRSLKNLVPYPCNICNTRTMNNRKIRHTANLLTVRQTHPELFV